MRIVHRHLLRVLVGVLAVTVLAAGASGVGQAAASKEGAAGAREAAYNRTFSGSGNRRLGTLRLRRAAVLRWRTRGALFQVSERHGFLLVNTRARRGHVRIHRGTYRGVRVATRGRWTITIRSR
jgi:hypothetical protein